MSDARRCSEVTFDCPVEATLYGYRPNIAINIVFAIIFGVLTITQIASICYFRIRTWSYSTPLVVATAMEAIGYVGRLLMNKNPWSILGISLQLICLIVAPSFMAAAISVTFKHIIVYCGAQYSMVRPKFIPLLMIGSDFLGIVIQFLGAGLLSMATTSAEPDRDKIDLGNNTIIFGVAFQVFVMIACGGYMVVYWRRLQNAKLVGPERLELPSLSRDQEYRQSTGIECLNFRRFCGAITVAFGTIFIRCVYRLIEMASGWRSKIQQDEPSFLVCDGLMIIVATICLTVFQPGFYFAPMMRK